MERAEGDRNDLLTISDQLAHEPKYVEGAIALRKFIERAIELEALPKEIILEAGEVHHPLVEEAEKDLVYNHPLFKYDSKKGRILTKENVQIELAQKENAVLKYLAERPNEYIKSEIININVLGLKADSGSAKGYIKRLRVKMPFWEESDGVREHRIIKSRTSFGYMFFDESRLGDESGQGEIVQS